MSGRIPSRAGLLPGAWLLLAAGLLPSLAMAAEPAAPSFGGALLKMLAALALVLGLFALGIYLLKRFGVVPGAVQGGDLRIERVVSLGSRSRLAVVRASGQRFLLGITPTQVNRIAELPEAEDEPSEHGPKPR